MIDTRPASREGARQRAIIQVTLWNSPYLGNFMRTQMLLAAAVRRELGLRTHFVLAPGAEEHSWLEELDSSGITWSILPARRQGWRRSLASTVSAQDGAVMHTHFTAADLPAAAAALAEGIPCVWQIHTGFAGYPVAQRAKDIYKIKLIARRRVARVVAVSPWLAELAQRRGVPERMIDVAPNPVDVARFARLPPPHDARASLGLDDAAPVVLCLGWWPRVKGVDIMLDAAMSLAADGHDFQLLLVGEQEMRDFVQAHLGAHPEWLRLSPFVSDSSVLFAAANVFVSASRHEGQNAAIGEALACGVSVLMSDIPGTSFWRAAPQVKTFIPGSAESLAQELRDTLNADQRQRASESEESRTWIQQNAAPEPWCARLCALYEQLV